MNGGAGHYGEKNVMLDSIRGFLVLNGSPSGMYNTNMSFLNSDPANGPKDAHMVRGLKEFGNDGYVSTVNSNNWNSHVSSFWRNRYPRMDNLFNQWWSDKAMNKYNDFDRNIFYSNNSNSSKPSQTTVTNSTSLSNLNDFVDPSKLNFKFKSPSPSWAPNIPFENIGLYTDTYRTIVPNKDAYRQAVSANWSGQASAAGSTYNADAVNARIYYNTGKLLFGIPDLPPATFVDLSADRYDYDLGTKTSPVFGSWVRISPETNGDITWSGSVNAVDRGSVSGINAANRDLIYSNQARTLEHKIANGTWDVVLNMGDASFAHDNMSVSVEGTVIAPDVDSAAGSFPYANGTVTVTDGSLSLTFSDNGGSDPNWVASRLSLIKVQPPSAPSGLSATASGSSQVALSWTDNSNNESNFRIDRQVGSGSWVHLAQVGSNVTSYSDTGLTAGTSYSYRVYGRNGTGDSGYSNTASATTSAGNQSPVWDFVGPTNFNGSSDYQTLPNPTAGDGATEVTIAVSVTPDTKGNWKGIVSNQYDSNQYFGLLTSGYGTGNPIEFRAMGSYILSPDNTCPVGVVTNIAAVWKSGQIQKLYLNGVEVASNASPPSGALDVNQWLVGSDRLIGGRYFDGQIEGLQIWTRALSASEISTLHGSGVSGPQLAGAGVGSVSPAGSMTDNGSGSYTVQGSGADIWGSADAFHFASEAVTGADGALSVRVDSLTNTNVWAKAGVHYRDSNAAGSKNVGVYCRPDGQVAMQWRASTNGASAWHGTLVGGTGFAKWVRLTKVGNSFTGAWSTNGSSWTDIQTVTVNMDNANLKGLAVTSHNVGTLTTAQFSNFESNWTGAATVLSTGITPPTGLTQLELRHSGRCVDNNGATANGVEYQQWACSPSPNRNMTFTALGGGYYSIRSEGSDRCLDVAGGNTTDGGKLHQWDCNAGNINQSWKLDDRGNGWFQLVSRKSEKCLDVENSSTADQARILQKNCDTAKQSQQLRFK